MEKEQLEFRSEFMRNLVRKGLEKGLAEGLAKGLAKGRAEGRAEGLRGAIRTLLDARDIQLSATQLRRLDRCEDLAVLDDWVQRAARAKSANDVFPPATRKRRSAAQARATRARKAPGVKRPASVQR